MGEYADMILNGESCQVCGAYMEGGDGYPRTCKLCRKEESKSNVTEYTHCPICNKKIKRVGLADHSRDAHKEKK